MQLKKIEDYLVFVPIIILCIIKIPHLSLPFFWDEAWSYYPAVKSMAENGPSLLPGAISLAYSKGHPQLFLFLISSWMNIAPGSMPFLRSFNFILSCILLLIIYRITLKEVNLQSGVMAISLMSAQSLFLAQSSMIFPEVLASLFLVTSVFLFYKKNYRWYALSASLMVLTKETFILFAFSLGIYYLFSLFNRQNRKLFKPIHLLLLLAPAIIYGIHLLLNYNEFKIIFYNEHTNYIDLRWEQIKSKFVAEVNTIFIHRGRILITITLVLALIASLIFKIKIKSINLFWILLTSLIPYLIFSSMNFYAFRYMLAPMILFIFVFSVIFGEILKSKLILYLITIGVFSSCLYYSITVRKTDDHSLGYVEVSTIQKDLVNYCERHNLYNEPISTNFLVSYAFKGPEYGYRTTNTEFTHVMPWSKYRECKYFIYDLTPDVPDDTMKVIQSKFKLVKSFENKHAKGYIYENENYKLENEDN